VLSNVRDAPILLDTAHNLFDRFGDRYDKSHFGDAEDKLRRLSDRMTSAATDPERLQHARLQTEKARACATRIKPSSNGWRAISPGLRQTFRKARKAYLRSRQNGDSANFHEWRKDAKYVRYHIELLSRSRPRRLEPLAEELHRLTDLLGEMHDLDLLSRALQRTKPKRAAEIDALIEHRWRELRVGALILGHDLFAEKPKRFAKDLHACWRNWHR